MTSKAAIAVARSELTRQPVQWTTSVDRVPYAAAVAAMERRARAIAEGLAPEMIWLLEHPPVLTAGTSARLEDLRDPGRFPLHVTGRGGQLTYHGPGQRVVYVMLDVRRRFGGDVRAFVASLERWIVAALKQLGVPAHTIQGRTGVWAGVSGEEQAAKIAAIGVRISRGVSLHGLAINVAPDLDHFGAIVPCGIADAGVTSLRALGCTADISAFDAELANALVPSLGPLTIVPGCPPDMEAPGSASTEPGALS